jgi:polyhydroxybutyrate depolymerase
MSGSKRPWTVVLTGLLIISAVAACTPRATTGPPDSGGEAIVVQQPGNPQQHVVVNGLERTYRLHLPPTLDSAVPLVLAFHGSGGQGPSMAGLTRFDALADRHGFVVAYPDGIDRHWHDGRAGSRPGQSAMADDVAFVRALIDHLAATLPIDRARVFATGMSNGAIFSQRLACDLTDQIAAIGAVAGSLAETLAPTCAPSRPVPVLMIMGDADPLVPWSGGPVRGRGYSPVLSVPDTVAHWVAHNGCAATPTITQEPDRAPADGTTVRREAHTNCRDGADVTLYAVVNGGHHWPGGPRYLPEQAIGKTNQDIDASAIIWDFFATHPRR